MPPTTSAGPRLRAGLTDVPVKGMPIRCTAVKVSPIAKPAVVVFPCLPVTDKMTKTKRAVKITSARNAPPALRWINDAAP